MNYLDPYNSQSSNIILGGLFFQEFFAVFENDYTIRYDPEQQVSLYVGRNSLLNAYVGNEELPTGVNPFVPQPPSPEDPGNKVSVAWIIVLSLLCAVMLGFLGFALWKWKLAQAKVNANTNGSGAVTDGGVTAPLVNHSG